MVDPRPSSVHSTTPLGFRAEVAGVVLVGVTRLFGMVPALVRVDLEVARGETVLIHGPNGAGKSTLLRIIATALAPSYGFGSVLGHDLLEGREEIRRRTEFLGHRTRLYEDLTARENLRFSCALFRADPADIPTALARVGLSQAADLPVRGYSQGMRQRVALARVLARRPDLLLLDEPYAGLDPEAKDVVDRVVLAAQSEGRTVIIATHDTGRDWLAGRSLFMDGGRFAPLVSQTTKGHLP